MTRCWLTRQRPVLPRRRSDDGCARTAEATPPRGTVGSARNLARSASPSHGGSTVSVDTPPSQSLADRLARKILLIEDADPKALMSLKGSLLLSAIRCVITYAILPAAAPLFGLSEAIGAPVGIVVSLAAITLSVHSLRRVWLAQWTYRWSYTAFIGVVLALLTWLLVLDVRAVLG